jgi:hypothetical protein
MSTIPIIYLHFLQYFLIFTSGRYLNTENLPKESNLPCRAARFRNLLKDDLAIAEAISHPGIKQKRKS